jgi:hypothetical protein
MFLRKLADRCVGEVGDVRVPVACRGRLEVGVEMVSCLPDHFPVALAWVLGRLNRGLCARLELGDLSPVSRILAVAGAEAFLCLWTVVSGEGLTIRVSFTAFYVQWTSAIAGIRLRYLPVMGPPINIHVYVIIVLCSVS